VDPESEIQEEYGSPQAPSCVSANIVREQAKPRCIPPIMHVFYFESLIYAKFDYALSL
jgi:hypothetical protein